MKPTIINRETIINTVLSIKANMMNQKLMTTREYQNIKIVLQSAVLKIGLRKSFLSRN